MERSVRFLPRVPEQVRVEDGLLVRIGPTAAALGGRSKTAALRSENR
jgi:hypothetical protein